MHAGSAICFEFPDKNKALWQTERRMILVSGSIHCIGLSWGFADRMRNIENHHPYDLNIWEISIFCSSGS